MLNETIFRELFNFFGSTPWLAFIAIFCAKWLPFILIVMAALCVICHRMPDEAKVSLRAFFTPTNIRRYIFELFFTFLPATMAWVLVDVIKHFHPIARPFQELGFTPLVMVDDPMGSFPSGHATAFAALAMTIYLRDKKTGKWFLLGALLVGLARIAVGVHYPLDILAGCLLGGLVAFSGHHILNRRSEHLTKSKEVIK